MAAPDPDIAPPAKEKIARVPVRHNRIASTQAKYGAIDKEIRHQKEDLIILHIFIGMTCFTVAGSYESNVEKKRR